MQNVNLKMQNDPAERDKIQNLKSLLTSLYEREETALPPSFRKRGEGENNFTF